MAQDGARAGQQQRGRRAVLAGLALLLAAPASAHPPVRLTPQGNRDAIEEIEAFRKQLVAAIAAKDIGVLRKAYAEGYFHMQADGTRHDREARIAAALAGRPLVEARAAREIGFAIHAGGWAAVAHGITDMPQADGKSRARAWGATYVRNQDQWQLAASHETPGQADGL